MDAGGAFMEGGEDLDVHERVAVEVIGDEVFIELYDFIEAVFRGGCVDEVAVHGRLEVAGDTRSTGVTFEDCVCGGDDVAIFFLSKDFVEGDGGDGGGIDDVFENSAGADRGELVDVADEEEVCGGGDGVEKRSGEVGVDHAGFVDDKEVSFEGGTFVVDESVGIGVVFEETVNGLGVGAGCLGHALSGATGGGSEEESDFFGFKNIDEGS